MPKWTQSVDEFNRVQQIMLDARPSQYVKITLKDQDELVGWLVNSSWGTDGVINHTRGLGPIVKSMWGEMRVLTGKGTSNIDAVEVQSIQQIPVPHSA
jgi:hypothetical protein